MTAVKKLTHGDNRYFFKMFRFMKPYAVLYAVSQLIYTSQIFLMDFVLSVFMGSLMAAILAQDAGGIVNATLTLAIMFAGMFLILGIGSYTAGIITLKAVMDMKKAIFRAFMRSGVESVTHSGEGIAVINTDADTATEVYMGPLMHIMSCIIGIVASSVVIFAIDWRVGFALLIVGVIGYILQSLFVKPLAKLGVEQLETNAESVKSVSNIFAGAAEIRAYKMESHAYITFDKENNRLKFLGFKQGLIMMYRNLFETVEGWLSLVTIFGLGGWLVATGRLEFHLLMVISGLAAGLTRSISGIGKALASLQVPIAGAKRVLTLIDNSKAASSAKQSITNTKSIGHKICINDLNFTYKGAERKALESINLTIEENQMIAFVGESGSGKSTLLKLITGLYERDDINITLGGVNLNDCTQQERRKHFAYVDQSCKLFDMSIKENIAMGKGGKATDEEIIQAAEQAGVSSFATGLENGYDSPCGESGSSLSGGQKQRIAIARALVKDAPVLVFDEVTSALDTESEFYIMETIESLRKNHTVLITTHNLKNIISADKIVVMDSGRIAEVGTHQELIDKGGLYSRLCKES